MAGATQEEAERSGKLSGIHWPIQMPIDRCLCVLDESSGTKLQLYKEVVLLAFSRTVSMTVPLLDMSTFSTDISTVSFFQ